MRIVLEPLLRLGKIVTVVVVATVATFGIAVVIQEQEPWAVTNDCTIEFYFGYAKIACSILTGDEDATEQECTSACESLRGDLHGVLKCIQPRDEEEPCVPE